jgi:hypothetical protein
MVVKIVERYKDEVSDLPVRVTIAFALVVSLVRSRKDIEIEVVEVRGEKVQAHSVLKSRLNAHAVKDAQREFVTSRIRSHLGTTETGLYDGFNLLHAAAMMPQQLQSTPGLKWRSIMRSRVKMSELREHGEIIAIQNTFP